MATGHINPGYSNVITKLKLFRDNQSAHLNRPKLNNDELDEIKNKAKAAWSVKDNSETTYGYFHSDPQIKEKTHMRPTSPTRRNNPHPHLVFLTARLKSLPGHFDANAGLRSQIQTPAASGFDSTSIQQFEERSQIFRAKTAVNRVAQQPSVSVYENTSDYLQSMPQEEAYKAEVDLQNAGIDTKNVRKPTGLNRAKSSIVYHFASRDSDSNLGFYNNSQASFINKKEEKPKIKLQTNLLNPYLYDDIRVYKQKYALGDHGLPHPYAKRPARGDFVIHYDWKPTLPHHRLPYDD